MLARFAARSLVRPACGHPAVLTPKFQPVQFRTAVTTAQIKEVSQHPTRKRDLQKL